VTYLCSRRIAHTSPALAPSLTMWEGLARACYARGDQRAPAETRRGHGASARRDLRSGPQTSGRLPAGEARLGHWRVGEKFFSKNRRCPRFAFCLWGCWTRWGSAAASDLLELGVAVAAGEGRTCSVLHPATGWALVDSREAIETVQLDSLVGEKATMALAGT
jgi:hypothetical protein